MLIIFTNIPLQEIINIWANTLFGNMEKEEALTKIEFKEFLSLATKKFYYIFNGKLFKQVNGVAMGSP